MLPLFFCIFEILLQMAGIVTICKSHCTALCVPTPFRLIRQSFSKR